MSRGTFETRLPHRGSPAMVPLDRAGKRNPARNRDGSGVRLTILAGLAVILAAATPTPTPAQPQTPARSGPLRVDHYVPVVSEVPSMAGETALIYVRERVLSGTVARAQGLEGRVVIFVHGAGTPAEVAFDAPGASWMGHLARSGYDAFSIDMTGYGRSTRPSAMNDPCNLPEGQQTDLVPLLLPSPCEPSYPFAATTIASDWHDLDMVIEHVKALRGVERVHLIGWSLGGPRAGGYAARYPENVASVVLLSPAYGRGRPGEPPDEIPTPGATMTKQGRGDFVELWDGQLGCEDQYEPRVRESVWRAMLASDPVGATWGTGVRRAPRLSTWGFNAEEVGAMTTPMLLVAPATDGQVSPERVMDLYQDLGSDRKVLVDLACASHNAMWETNRTLLFNASLQWLRDGAVNGVESGELRLGY